MILKYGSLVLILSRFKWLARTLLSALYQTEADLLPDPKKQILTVRLHHLANVMSDKVIEKLCVELSATETRFPRTNLIMIFKVGSI